jgi:Lrp/AsnC family leucine-responsive transcriptional regulator
MKLGNGQEMALDAIDLDILATLQEDCKIPLARIGDRVGLSAPSVIERIKKLEQAGVTAFIGVLIAQPPGIQDFEGTVSALEGVLECHHVTGGYTLLLKVKTQSTSALEKLISQIRCIPGVTRTETMVVLSTHTERSQVPLTSHPVHDSAAALRRRASRGTAAVG